MLLLALAASSLCAKKPPKPPKLLSSVCLIKDVALEANLCLVGFEWDYRSNSISGAISNKTAATIEFMTLNFPLKCGAEITGVANASASSRIPPCGIISFSGEVYATSAAFPYVSYTDNVTVSLRTRASDGKTGAIEATFSFEKVRDQHASICPKVN